MTVYVDPDGSQLSADDLAKVQSSQPPQPSMFQQLTNWAGRNLPQNQPNAPAETPEDRSYQQALYLAQSYGAISTGVDADKIARDQEAAGILGVPQEALAYAPNETRQAALTKAQSIQNSPDDWQQFTQQYPATSKYLADGKNMAVSHDDIQSLSAIEEITQNISASYQLAELERERAQIELPIFGGNANSLNDLSVTDQQRVTDINQQMADLQSKISNNPWSLAGIGSNVGSLASMAKMAGAYGIAGGVAGATVGAVGGPAGAIAGAGIGFESGMAGNMGETAASNIYHELLEKNVDPDKARHAAQAVGVINTALGAAGVPTLIKMIPGGNGLYKSLMDKAVSDVVANPETASQVAQSVIKEITKSAGVMGGMSMGSEIANIGAEKYAGVNDDTLGQSAERIGQAGLNSIPSGIALGLIPGAAAGLKGFDRLSESAKEQSTIKSLGDVIADSKTRSRTPDTFENFMTGATEGTPTENVYIPAAKLVEYFQSQHPDEPDIVDQKAEALGISQDKLNEAINTEGDLEIPTAKAATVLSDDWKGLAQDMKFAPDAMTGREESEHGQDIIAQMNQTVDEPPTTLDTWRQKMLDAGIKGQQADHAATLLSAFGDSIENRSGGVMKAEDLANAVGIQKEQAPGIVDKVKQLFQTNKEPLGSYTPNEGLGGLIKIFQGADKSTVIHEAGHMFLDTINKLSNVEGVSDEMKGYNDTIREWLGAKDGEPLNVDQHEHFAKAFESYIMDGKAPSMDLSRAFSKFRDWMVNIYARVRSSGAEIPPEIKNVFDRMLSSDDDIKRMEAAQGYGKFLGRDMKVKDYSDYARMQDKAHELAVNEVIKKRMADIDPDILRIR